MTTKTYDQDNAAEIEALLLGHTVTKVDSDRLQLDDGTILILTGHDGGCGCNSGCYDLTELNGVDNIITKVELVADPAGDGYDADPGTYRIFVYADNVQVNLATFEGTDGNGWYGTGFSIEVRRR